MMEKSQSLIPIKKGALLGMYGENYIIALGEEENVFMLTPIAYYIWDLCDGESTTNDIVSIVKEELNLDHDDARNVVSIVLKKLNEIGLIYFK